MMMKSRNGLKQLNKLFSNTCMDCMYTDRNDELVRHGSKSKICAETVILIRCSVTLL